MLGASALSRVLAEHMPGYRVRSVVRLGAGLEHTAFEVNGELVVRIDREPDPARVAREARLLEAVKDLSPVPVPQPLFVAPQEGCLGYFTLPGAPLIDMLSRLRSARIEPIAAVLGGLLTALHAAPAARLAPLVDNDDTPLSAWRDDARGDYAAVAGRVPTEYKKAIEAFLSATPPPGTAVLVFSHNDLGIEHVLVDPATWEVTGVIDWSDAAMADPAHDFGLLYRDLGPAALDAIVRHYRGGGEDVAALRKRAVFHARCGVFEDLAFGIRTSRVSYVEKSLSALGWLFSVG